MSGLPGPIPLRQVTPRRPGAQLPQDAVDHLAVIPPLAATTTATRQHGLDPRPRPISQFTPANHRPTTLANTHAIHRTRPSRPADLRGLHARTSRVRRQYHRSLAALWADLLAHVARRTQGGSLTRPADGLLDRRGLSSRHMGEFRAQRVCRLPWAWDHLRSVLARGMGPPVCQSWDRLRGP